MLSLEIFGLRKLRDLPRRVAEHHVETAALEHFRKREMPVEKVEALAQILDHCRSLALVAATGERVPQVRGGWRGASLVGAARGKKGRRPSIAGATQPPRARVVFGEGAVTLGFSLHLFRRAVGHIGQFGKPSREVTETERCFLNSQWGF